MESQANTPMNDPGMTQVNPATVNAAVEAAAEDQEELGPEEETAAGKEGGTDEQEDEQAQGEPLFNQYAAREAKAQKYERPVEDSFSAKVMLESESVQRAKFPQLTPEITQQALGKIEYLKDVDLEASVELGNAVLTVEKIIGLNVGSIIELNQSVGDQIRVLINGNPYAYGEVVVIGDKFGVRITKIIHE